MVAHRDATAHNSFQEEVFKEAGERNGLVFHHTLKRMAHIRGVRNMDMVTTYPFRITLPMGRSPNAKCEHSRSWRARLVGVLAKTETAPFGWPRSSSWAERHIRLIVAVSSSPTNLQGSGSGCLNSEAKPTAKTGFVWSRNPSGSFVSGSSKENISKSNGEKSIRFHCSQNSSEL